MRTCGPPRRGRACTITAADGRTLSVPAWPMLPYGRCRSCPTGPAPPGPKPYRPNPKPPCISPSSLPGGRRDACRRSPEMSPCRHDATRRPGHRRRPRIPPTWPPRALGPRDAGRLLFFILYGPARVDSFLPIYPRPGSRRAGAADSSPVVLGLLRSSEADLPQVGLARQVLISDPRVTAVVVLVDGTVPISAHAEENAPRGEVGHYVAPAREDAPGADGFAPPTHQNVVFGRADPMRALGDGPRLAGAVPDGRRPGHQLGELRLLPRPSSRRHPGTQFRRIAPTGAPREHAAGASLLGTRPPPADPDHFDRFSVRARSARSRRYPPILPRSHIS